MNLGKQLQNRTNIKKNLDEQKEIQSEESEELSEERPKVIATEDLTAKVLRKGGKITREAFRGEVGKRLSVELPETVFKAIGHYCTNKSVTRAEVTFDLFVKLLTKEGYLK
jgi:hypothetical protein